MMGVDVEDAPFTLTASGKVPALSSSPTNKKAPAIARATGFRGLGLVHPFENRNSQNAAPRLQTAWPLLCSYTCWALSWASSSCTSGPYWH